MRRIAAKYTPSPIEQAGQRAWNEAYGYHRANARRWFCVAVGCMGIAGYSVHFALQQSTEAKVIPFVVERDSLGSSVAVQRLHASVPDAGRIRGHLKTWVQGFRSVYSDAAAQTVLVKQSFAWVEAGSLAYAKLNEWYLTNQPFNRAKSETVSAEVVSVLLVGGSTYQIDWRETSYPREPGRASTVTAWRMTATINISLPETEAEIMANWDGVYVSDFNVQTIVAGQ